MNTRSPYEPLISKLRGAGVRFTSVSDRSRPSIIINTGNYIGQKVVADQALMEAIANLVGGVTEEESLIMSEKVKECEWANAPLLQYVKRDADEVKLLKEISGMLHLFGLICGLLGMSAFAIAYFVAFHAHNTVFGIVGAVIGIALFAFEIGSTKIFNKVDKVLVDNSSEASGKQQF